MKEISLRRSSSERKLAKEKKKERKEKSRSVHFDGNGDHLSSVIVFEVFHSRFCPYNPTNLYNWRHYSQYILSHRYRRHGSQPWVSSHS